MRPLFTFCGFVIGNSTIFFSIELPQQHIMNSWSLLCRNYWVSENMEDLWGVLKEETFAVSCYLLLTCFFVACVCCHMNLTMCLLTSRTSTYVVSGTLVIRSASSEHSGSIFVCCQRARSGFCSRQCCWNVRFIDFLRLIFSRWAIDKRINSSCSVWHLICKIHAAWLSETCAAKTWVQVHFVKSTGCCFTKGELPRALAVTSDSPGKKPFRKVSPSMRQVLSRSEVL